MYIDLAPTFSVYSPLKKNLILPPGISTIDIKTVALSTELNTYLINGVGIGVILY